jgi:hypothetical protein
MAYILAGVTIRNPHEMAESNSTQMAVQRALNGTVARDYFGNNKRVWKLTFKNAKPSEYTALYTIYTTYLATNITQTWQVTEANYPISQTNVHIDMPDRGFSVQGDTYLSDFELTLTEA